jgi:Ca-activated chloride channel homolog
MTFGALAAWQAWLLIAAAGGIAASLFLLKVRPPRVVVPSLLLWRRVLSESREVTLWERIRRAVSLVITAAIAVALALAFARPSRTAGAAPGPPGRVLVVIDSSWSMLARTRNGATRWDRAIAEARRLASAASGGTVALATTADGLVEGPTTDLTVIDAALDRIAPSGGGMAAWPRLAGADAVHFITDGAIARPPHANVTIHSVFETATNAGITAFDVRPSLDHGAAAADAYLEVVNFGPARSVHVTLSRGAAPILDRRFDMAAGETLRQVVPLARGGDPEVRARIDAPGDALAIDDEAFGSIEHARPLSVTVVGAQSTWLAPLFADDPDVKAAFVTPADYRPAREDVVIFDRWTPKDPPTSPALYFAPPPETPWLAGDAEHAKAAAVEKRPEWIASSLHPVVSGIDPSTLTIDTARGYGSAHLAPVARSAHGTPLVYVSDSSMGPRVVLVTFGAHESNLASAPAFPVLVGNALDWLARPAVIGAHRPGPAAFDDAIERVTDPHGVAVPLVAVQAKRIGMLRSPGWYVAEGNGSRTTFAVNIADPDVSNLSRTDAGTARAATRVTTAGFGRPWWLYCAVLAFAALLAEWWTWLRRITV